MFILIRSLQAQQQGLPGLALPQLLSQVFMVNCSTRQSLTCLWISLAQNLLSHFFWGGYYSTWQSLTCLLTSLVQKSYRPFSYCIDYRQIEPKTSLVIVNKSLKKNVSDTRVKENFRKYSFLNEWAVNDYAENISYLYLTIKQ